jgi:hypothetical protein
MPTTLEHIAQQIIKEQELVIGPLAWNEAAKVTGLSVDPVTKNVLLIDADQKAVIDRLVAQYERLFGGASREVCREAAAGLLTSLPKSDIPASLSA